MRSTYIVSSIGKFAGYALAWLRCFAIVCLGFGAAAASATTISSIRFVSNGGTYINDTITEGGTSPLGITSSNSLNQLFLNASDSTVTLNYGSYYAISFRTFGAHIGAGTVSFLLNGDTPYSKNVTFPDPKAASGVFASFALPGGDSVSISSTGLSADRIRVVADGGGLTPDGTADAFYLLTFIRGAQTASTYDAASDFSLAANPNGVWSYGYKPNGTAAFQLFDTAKTNLQAGTGFQTWNKPTIGAVVPYVVRNPSNSAVTYGSFTLDAGALGFHPGINGEQAVVRWTTPSANPPNLSRYNAQAVDLIDYFLRLA